MRQVAALAYPIETVGQATRQAGAARLGMAEPTPPGTPPPPPPKNRFEKIPLPLGKDCPGFRRPPFQIASRVWSCVGSGAPGRRGLGRRLVTAVDQSDFGSLGDVLKAQVPDIFSSAGPISDAYIMSTEDVVGIVGPMGSAKTTGSVKKAILEATRIRPTTRSAGHRPGERWQSAAGWRSLVFVDRGARSGHPEVDRRQEIRQHLDGAEIGHARRPCCPRSQRAPTSDGR